MLPTTSRQTSRHRLSGNALEIFRNAVNYIINDWPSLNLAIEHGMGGPAATQKRNWISDTIVELFCENKMDNYDLCDYLGELINNEFDTLFEDGSVEYNVTWMERFYQDCLKGKEQEVFDSINQASNKKKSTGNIKVPPAVQDKTQDSELENDDDDEIDEDDNERITDFISN